MTPAIRKLVAIRDITIRECPWLREKILAGTVLTEFQGHTYGCVGPTGVAVKLINDEHEPFYEVPEDAVKPLA